MIAVIDVILLHIHSTNIERHGDRPLRTALLVTLRYRGATPVVNELGYCSVGFIIFICVKPPTTAAQ